MKKFHVTRKTVLTIVGVTLPLTAAAILLLFIHRLCRTILFWRLTAMKKFHVTRKTVLTIVGVTLPLTAAAILLPRLKRSRRARSVRA